ncbi:MAG TPA: hypothetical protein VI381_06525 [Allosphingosinicella sp.]
MPLLTRAAFAPMIAPMNGNGILDAALTGFGPAVRAHAAAALYRVTYYRPLWAETD